MNVLIIGDSDKERALSWMMSRSPKIKNIYCTPGNAEIARYAECVDLAIDNVLFFRGFVKEKEINTTIVGFDSSLTAGIIKVLKTEGLGIIDPCKADALLEGSEAWVEYFRAMYQIPSTTRETFAGFDPAKIYLNKIKYPAVVKPAGLAGGVAVKLCNNYLSALLHLEDIMPNGVYGRINEVMVIN